VVKISRRLGHASVDITLRVYAHLFRKRDDKSSAAINAAVASLFQGFSNRPVGVKRFQTIHRNSGDVARGLVLLSGIGT